MRQTRGAVTRFKQHGTPRAVNAAFLFNIQPFEDKARLFKGPSFGSHKEVICHSARLGFDGAKVKQRES